MGTLGKIFDRFARGFVRRAGVISGTAWSVANSGFLFKDYLQNRTPHVMEQASGALSLSASGIMLLTDKFPRLKIPAGICALLGTVAMGIGAWGQKGQNAQIFAASVTSTFALSMIFEKSFNNAARKMADSSKRVLRAVFTPLAKSPVAATAALDVTLSSLPMAYAAITRRDVPLFVMSMLWVTGGLAAMATDNSVKAWLTRQPKTPHIS